MRSNRNLFFLGAIVLSGCGSEPSLVSVDIDLASQEGLRETAPSPSDFQPAPSPRVESVTAKLFGLQESTSSRGQLAREAAQAQEVLEHNRLVALRSLREQLFRSNRKDVETWRQSASLDMASLEKKDREEAYNAIGAKLREIAPERGKVLSDLSFLTTFPIQPPANWPPVPAESPWRIRRREDALSLYASLKAIDSRFEENAEGIIAAANQKTQRRKEEFQLQYADRLDEARSRATQEADNLTAKSAKTVESRLANFAERPAMAIPSVEVNVGPQKLPPPIVQKPELDREARLSASRKRAVHDLKIWLSLKGYRLAEPVTAGRDVTEEFMKWRRDHHPGR